MRIALSAALLSSALMTVPAAWSAQQATATVEVAFTPQDDVAALIVERIRRARHSVQVQAYLFTDRAVANALLAARRRGVAVELIGDAAQHESGGLRYAAALQRAGAQVFLDGGYAAAHDKIVIVDGAYDAATVITGSYNFTEAARSRNAENIVVISGSRAVTDRFVENFAFHRARSIPWTSTPSPAN